MLNSSNKEYYKLLLEAKEIDLNDSTKVLEVLEEYEKNLPKSNTHVRLCVDLLPAGPEFERKLEQYLRPLLIKGVPSMINELKVLYKTPLKADILGKLLLRWNENMEKNMSLDGKTEDEQDPTVQLWLYYFLSQHGLRLGKVEEAFNWINKAIEHTPTVVELYNHKAKIFKFGGNPAQAVELTEQGRGLDLADRYLNAHSSKYLFQNNEVEKAHKTMAQFSREDENGKINVHEMQTMWFEYQAGLAHYRKGELRQALKQFHFIEIHLDTMMDDCYDFHYYSFRKGTVNHYLQMLEFQEGMYKGKWPTRGCINQLRVLFKAARKGAEGAKKAIAEYEEYQKSDDYKKWKEEFDKREEDDPVRHDPDPEGYELYIQALEDSVKLGLTFAQKCFSSNPENADLQLKCLKMFIKAKDAALASKAAKNLLEKCTDHPKTPRAMQIFTKDASSLDKLD